MERCRNAHTLKHENQGGEKKRAALLWMGGCGPCVNLCSTNLSQSHVLVDIHYPYTGILSLRTEPYNGTTHCENFHHFMNFSERPSRGQRIRNKTVRPLQAFPLRRAICLRVASRRSPALRAGIRRRSSMLRSSSRSAASCGRPRME